MQQIEFDRGQLHRLAILANNSSGGIKLNITDPDDFWDLILARSFCVFFRGLGSTQNGSDAGHQFAGIERLGEIVVGANFEAYDSVHILTACGEQKDRDTRRVPYPP